MQLFECQAIDNNIHDREWHIDMKIMTVKIPNSLQLCDDKLFTLRKFLIHVKVSVEDEMSKQQIL